MKILFAASEMTPYAKTGGLGDVVGALAGVLQKSGHEVTCCIPYYRCARLWIEKEKAARSEIAPYQRLAERPQAGRSRYQRPEDEAKAIGLTLSIPLGSRTVT